MELPGSKDSDPIDAPGHGAAASSDSTEKNTRVRPVRLSAIERQLSASTRDSSLFEAGAAGKPQTASTHSRSRWRYVFWLFMVIAIGSILTAPGLKIPLQTLFTTVVESALQAGHQFGQANHDIEIRPLPAPSVGAEQVPPDELFNQQRQQAQDVNEWVPKFTRSGNDADNYLRVALLMEQAAQLLPALLDDGRYTSLLAQINRGELTTAETGEVAAVEPVVVSAKTAVEKPVAPPPVTVPEIQDVSITYGSMAQEHFVPAVGGRVLMVQFSYKNFYAKSVEAGDNQLVARLRKANDPLLLTEVPIVVSGDRGTRSFPIDTSMAGDVEGNYQLEFILGGEILAVSDIQFAISNQ